MKILIWDNSRYGWVKFTGDVTEHYYLAESFDSIKAADVAAHSHGLQSYELFVLLK